MSEQLENTSTDKPRKAPLRCRLHGKMADWLRHAAAASLLPPTPRASWCLSAASEDKFRFQTQKFTRPMGMAVNGERLAIAVREQILTFRFSPDANTFQFAHAYQTGKVNAHDLAFGRSRLVFRQHSIQRFGARLRHQTIRPLLAAAVCIDDGRARSLPFEWTGHVPGTARDGDGLLRNRRTQRLAQRRPLYFRGADRCVPIAGSSLAACACPILHVAIAASGGSVIRGTVHFRVRPSQR